MYSMSAGSPMPRVSFCGSSCSYIRRSDSVIPGSPPVNIWISSPARSPTACASGAAGSTPRPRRSASLA